MYIYIHVCIIAQIKVLANALCLPLETKYSNQPFCDVSAFYGLESWAGNRSHYSGGIPYEV